MQTTGQWDDWQWQFRNARRSCGLPEVESRYPVFFTPYAETLLAHRSCRLQILPDKRELSPDSSAVGGDPFCEKSKAAKCFGVKQRFRGRILVMTSSQCAMNCRHCTRKGLLADAQVVRTPEQLSRAVDYVRANPRIHDVLLSGGDIMTLPDDAVMRFVDAFASLEQIDIVRVCSRVPSMLPMRITPAIARRLGSCAKVWFNTQFNCAEEMTAEAQTACARLVDAGIPVSCQTVLLRGVNDSAAKMEALCRALVRARVRPYYVFVCDPVEGMPHLRVSVEKARKIEAALAKRVGGLALPRFVADIPGAPCKTPVALLHALP